MTLADLRSQFPVCARYAYLNAGTCGPIARDSITAVGDELQLDLAEGRWAEAFERATDIQRRLRRAYAERLGASAEDLALTTSTSDGIVRVLGGLDLSAGDEVLTSVDEHPGLQGPLAALRDRTGVTIREVAFERLADEVTPATRLVACSHVSWITGARAPAALADVAVPVLFDGAQGAGAIPVDVGALGCDFYAASGQKWLCGPVGSGMLWIAPEWARRLPASGPTYVNLDDPSRGLAARPRDDASRHDASALSGEQCAFALAAHETLGAFGWDAVHARACALASILADALGDCGRTVAPRADTTLVSWEEPDPAAARNRLAAAGVIVRDLPGKPYVRASVGAWNDESDLERLLAALD